MVKQWKRHSTLSHSVKWNRTSKRSTILKVVDGGKPNRKKFKTQTIAAELEEGLGLGQINDRIHLPPTEIPGAENESPEPSPFEGPSGLNQEDTLNDKWGEMLGTVVDAFCSKMRRSPVTDDANSSASKEKALENPIKNRLYCFDCGWETETCVSLWHIRMGCLEVSVDERKYNPEPTPPSVPSQGGF